MQWPVNRVFSDDKVVASKLLNLLGVQVMRALAARLLYSVRRDHVVDSIKEKAIQLRTDGILIWPNFLPPEDFEMVQQEFHSVIKGTDGTSKTHKQGSSTLSVISVNSFSEIRIPSTYEFLADQRLRAVLESAEKRPLDDLWRYGQFEVLTQEEDAAQEDTESQLHSDIWFNTHKAWFYLDDVTKEDGPLVYLKGSHHLNLVQLYYLYGESWKRSSESNPSRRIPRAEIEHLGLAESVVTCGKNTLVVANTCGYHRRLQGRAGRRRHALHLFLRADPFVAYSLRAKLARHPRLWASLRAAKAALFSNP